MPPTVSRTSRLLDLASLTIAIAGAVCFAWAFMRTSALKAAAAAAQVSSTGHFAAIAELDRLNWWSKVGIGLVAAGVAIGIGAAVHSRRTTPRTR